MPVRVRISFPSLDTPLYTDNQDVGVSVDTNIDTVIKAPKLHDFGGDCSKRWYIDYYVNGERKREWIKAHPVSNRLERAKKKLREIESLYSTKSQYYNLFEWIKLKENSKRTTSSYESYAREFNKLFPDHSKFTPEKLFDALNDGREAKTVKNIYLGIKTLFTRAYKRKLISENPFNHSEVELPTVHFEESDYNCPFNDYERRLIEEELKKTPGLFLLTRFIYYTFSRVEELRLLRIRDINLKARTIKFRAETTKGKRTVIKPILDPLLELILEAKVLNSPSNFYLFSTDFKPGPEPLPINFASKKHREALTKLGLYRPFETVLYSWKPTGAIAAYMAGMDMRIIQEMCAHKSIEHTEIYLRKLGLFLRKEAYNIRF